MRKATHYARTSALPAIAAALALTSTTALAQQAQPVSTDPPPVTTTTDQTAPATAPASAPADTGTAVDTAAPATDVKAGSTTATKTVRHTTHSAAKAAAKPVTTHVASRTVSTHAATAGAPAAAVKPAPAPIAPAQQSATKPIVDVNANPAPASTVAAKPAQKHDNTLPIAGGALAFLALGGAAVALTRRRHDDEEEWVNEESVEHQPVEAFEEPMHHDEVVHEQQPAMIAPAASAFAWGNEEARDEAPRAAEPMVEEDDRMPGESWVQRAYRGPTPNNPSVSLRARLKRAAFFDKREREVAAGKAEPVDMDAGLPEAMVEEQERELA